MNIIKIIAALVILVSCNVNSKLRSNINKDLSKYISEKYKPENITLNKVYNLSSKTKNSTTVEITIENSTIVNESNFEFASSDIVLKLYKSLNDSEIKNTNEFKIKFKEGNHSKVVVYETSTLKKVDHAIEFLEGYLALVNKKEYDLATEKFNSLIIDSAKIDLASLYGQLLEQTGDYKGYECNSFEMGDSKLNGKTIKILILYCTSFYEKRSVYSKYTIRLDTPTEQLLQLSIK